jgi:carbonic anhydrase/acetyltransferase-like protein (isoleucine patch superfamily)
VAIYQLGDDPEYAPQIAATAWVADNATVLGRVRMGENSSVWYGAVLRGDNDSITLGDRVNVQDGSVLHTDHGYPMVLGNDVSIGHLVMLHGCTIGEGSLVGIKAVILNGAKIGRNCLVGAGSVVTEGKEFPDNSLILGSPAKVVRELSPEQAARVRMAAAHYVENAVRHRDQLKRIG